MGKVKIDRYFKLGNLVLGIISLPKSVPSKLLPTIT